MRHNLETDPSVIRLADHLGIDRFAVVGRLKVIWSWADQHSVDGHAVSVTTSFLDSLVECEGFSAAMRKVGWLEGRDWDLEFPNFDRHNGSSAKKRAIDANRKAKSRSNSEKCHAAKRTESGPEKRREEKRRVTHTHTHSAEELKSHERVSNRWRELWHRWVDTWEGRMGKRFDPVQAEHQLFELCAKTESKAESDLRFSLNKYSKSILDSENDFERNNGRNSSKPTRQKF